MYKLRTWIGLLVWWLFLFYNIERVNAPLDIDTFVYVLVPLVGGVFIFLPNIFRRRNILLFVLPAVAIYFLLKVLIGSPIVGDGLAITVVEAVSVAITMLLVRQVAGIIWDFEDTIANLTFRQVGIPPRVYETTTAEDLYREVKRSRRFEHPLTLVCLEPDYKVSEVQLNKILLELQETMVSRYMQAQLAKVLSEELRDSDLVVLENGSFYVMLPETPQEDAEFLLRRLIERAQDKIEVDFQVGLARFPDQAVTLRGLVETATNEIQQKKRNLTEAADGAAISSNGHYSLKKDVTR